MRNAMTRREFLRVGGTASAAALVGSAALGSGGGVARAQAGQTVDSIIGRMTLQDKIHLVHGKNSLDVAVGYVPPLEGVGVPELRMADGPVGIRPEFGETDLGPATAFPATIAAASTWDRGLVREEGVALGKEAKAKGQDVLLGPAMNICRVPLNGRTFEYYSEDPYLTSRLVVENVLGVQAEGIVATAKHYACNNQEADRDFVSVEVSERALREIYLPAFEAAVKEGAVGSVMAAYNKVNGTYCAANERLLEGILKEEWGFEGFVVSDWGATHGTVGPALGGTDLEMPGEGVEGFESFFGESLRRAVEGGDVGEEVLDEKVRRILAPLALSGHLGGDKKGGAGEANTAGHQELARRIALEGTVLLKREGDTLPLRDEVGSVALIGYNADAAKIGGGGSSRVVPPRSTSPLEGIRARVAEGATVEYKGASLVPASAFSPEGEDGAGLRGEYFSDPAAYDEGFPGEPDLVRSDGQISFDWRGSPGEGIEGSQFAARWLGTMNAPASGVYGFVSTSFNGSRLYLDGDLVLDNLGDFDGPFTAAGRAELSEGGHDFRVEFQSIGDDPTLDLRWFTPEDVAEAADLAGRSEVALVFAEDDSRESEDRDSLALPGNQDEIIAAVADAQPDTVAVLRTGGAVLMPWLSSVPNVLETWFPGMEDGDALASVLFGDHNPSGKLPVTFGERPEDYPANTEERYPGTNGKVRYSEGVFVGYRHFDRENIQPLFAFGHGLSYTSFEYGNLRVRPGSGSSVAEVEAEVENVGDRAGAEVAQLYVGLPDQEGARMPPRQLKGFEKVRLKPGQRGRVSFNLDRRDLSYWDEGAGGWTVPAGTCRIMVGGSSRDIRLEGELEL